MLQSNYSIRNTVSRKGEVIVLYDINIFINKSCSNMTLYFREQTWSNYAKTGNKGNVKYDHLILEA